MQRAMLHGFLGFVLGAALCMPAWGDSHRPKVSIDTSAGTIVLELYPDRAPRTVANFLHYVHSGFYSGLIFHRVIPGFMIQGGGFDAHLKPRSTEAPIANEAANGIKNETGTVAMARTSDVNSATSQFFINVANNAALDHVNVPPQGVVVMRAGRPIQVTADQADQVFGYVVFGRVVSGMEVVKAIENVPTTSEGMLQNVPETPVVIRSMTETP